MVHPNVAKAYKEAEFEIREMASDVNERSFFEAATIAKEPVKRKITQIVRTKNSGKEYFYYDEHLTSKNKLGNKIDHTRRAGVYQAPNFAYQLNENGERFTTEIESTETVYELKWKEDFTADLQALVSDKVSLVLIGLGRNYSGFSYEQFKDCTYEELETIGKFGSLNPAVIERVKKKKNRVR